MENWEWKMADGKAEVEDRKWDMESFDLSLSTRLGVCGSGQG
jgi:hypothetical protein